MTTERSAAEQADWLLSAEAIRTQCQALFDIGLSDGLDHFAIHMDRLDACADEVVTTITANYPDLNVPPHARWRHFLLGGRDHWADWADGAALSVPERARLEMELAITSVLLDAGAGAAWRYTDPTSGAVYARSEGLALASLHLFLNGGFAGMTQMGTTTDGLMGFKAANLGSAFQVTEDNPLEGLEGRAALIQDLGAAVLARPDVFGETPRLGNLADHLFALAEDHQLPAPVILENVLDLLGPIWTGRPTLAGKPLGDCWPHPKAPYPGLVPFHKLSQWLSYSLVEPLERAGLTVTDLDGLTGLAEYRNGGLFLDTGVLTLRDAVDAPVSPDSPLVVEWRALTVCLLDRIAPLVRHKLGKSAEDMPLAAILEGGTWATGRRLAAEKRPGGTPPISIISTGTVF